jgi:hypothetical protein
MAKLKIGDKVMWRGAWGKEPAKEATITGIQLCGVGAKYGKEIKSTNWETVRNEKITVTLDNGHWAHGYQLDPKE